jgi:hypothetical protein
VKRSLGKLLICNFQLPRKPHKPGRREDDPYSHTVKRSLGKFLICNFQLPRKPHKPGRGGG